MKIIWRIKALCSLVVLAGVPCHGQVAPKWPDSSAKRILSAYRASKVDVVVLLRQASSPIGRQKLDEVADSLVQIALKPHVPADAVQRDRGWSAILALGDAGDRSVSEKGGREYSGALDRLIRIERETTDTALRWTALQHILRMEPFDRAVEYLLARATSTDEQVAWVAMGNILELLDPVKRAYRTSTVADRALVRTRVRQLWDRVVASPAQEKVVPNRFALTLLTQAASREGWARQ